MNTSKSYRKAEAKKEVQSLLTKLEAGVEEVRTSEGWARWLKFQASFHNFGMDTSNYTFGYIAYWKGAGAREGIKKSAKRIADTAKAIINALEVRSEALPEAC